MKAYPPGLIEPRCGENLHPRGEALSAIGRDAGSTQPLRLEPTPHLSEAAPGGTWILPRSPSRLELSATQDETTAPTVPVARLVPPSPPSRLGAARFAALLLGSTAFFLVLLSVVIHYYLRRG